MLNNTLDCVYNWFKEYQPHLNESEGQKLYIKLIEEEFNESMDALKNNDLVEFLDGCIDLFWVQQGYYYFGGTTEINFINPFELMFNNINHDGGDIIKDDLIKDLIFAVAESNYTKVYQLQSEGNKKGKVIKGPNFIPPTEKIKSIIEQYNITLITE